MTVELTLQTEFEIAVRLLVGFGLGALIGLERELDRHPAGLRTHALVATGAALFTIISGFAFTGPAADPTRIAAQIVSGIGFLGAGTIIQMRGSVKGLTTAASLWAVAAVGTAAGAGLLILAAVATIVILVILAGLERLEHWVERRLRLEPQTYATTDSPRDKEDDFR